MGLYRFGILMRKSEHMLRLSFDPEYQKKYSAWESILRMYIEIEIEYLTSPKKYMSNLSRLTISFVCLFAAISSGRLWWLGLLAGIVFTMLISLGVTAHTLWEERRKLGLDLVWPW